MLTINALVGISGRMSHSGRGGKFCLLLSVRPSVCHLMPTNYWVGYDKIMLGTDVGSKAAVWTCVSVLM